MKRESVFLMVFLIILVTSLSSALEVQRAEASGIIYVRADGSIDPPTAPIQRNGTVYTLTGNITSDTHGIIVEKDNIVLDGAGYTVTGSGSGNGIMLTGRSNVTVRNTMIENFTSGIHLEVSSSNTLSGNNVTANFFEGIYLDSSSNNTLSGNNVANNAGKFGHGIELQSSSNNALSGNNVASNTWGISLGYSSNNTLSGNVMGGDGDNFMVYSAVLSDYINSIDTSNLVNGKPIYYLMNQSNIVISPDAYPEVGYLGLVNCANVTVQGLTLAHSEGILLAFTKYSKITGNNVTANSEGIFLDSSSNNTLSGNNFTANRGNAIDLDASSNNTLSGNNVTGNHGYGILLYSCSCNALSGNNVTANAYAGIGLFSSSDNNTLLSNNVGNNGIGIMLAYSSDNNVLSGNNVTASNQYGVYLDSSSDNVLSGNNVTANKEDGIWLRNSFGNRIFHNNFSNNTHQTYVEGSINTWDNGFPSGGNYWSDYNGTDADHDGIGDTPYIIDANNTDHYPRMNIIPEFPSFLILPIFFVATPLAVIAYRRKHPQNE